MGKVTRPQAAARLVAISLSSTQAAAIYVLADQPYNEAAIEPQHPYPSSCA